MTTEKLIELDNIRTQINRIKSFLGVINSLEDNDALVCLRHIPSTEELPEDQGWKIVQGIHSLPKDFRDSIKKIGEEHLHEWEEKLENF